MKGRVIAELSFTKRQPCVTSPFSRTPAGFPLSFVQSPPVSEASMLKTQGWLSLCFPRHDRSTGLAETAAPPAPHLGPRPKRRHDPKRSPRRATLLHTHTPRIGRRFADGNNRPCTDRCFFLMTDASPIPIPNFLPIPSRKTPVVSLYPV